MVFVSDAHLPFIFNDLSADTPCSALLIHGFPGTPAEVRPMGEALAAHGWHARGMLLPGFGADIASLNRRSSSDWIYAAEQEWRALKAHGGSTLLIGYSMGAAVALHVAAHQPPDHLVLISPYWRTPALFAGLVPLVRRLAPNWRIFKKADFADPRIRGLFASLSMQVDLDDPQVRRYLRDEFFLPTAAMDELIHLGRGAYRLAPRVQAPTLILQGDQDPVVRPESTLQLSRQLGASQVRLRQIPAMHDLLQASSPQLHQVVSEVIAFVRDETPCYNDEVGGAAVPAAALGSLS
jgi:carboxylesterase